MTNICDMNSNERMHEVTWMQCKCKNMVNFRSAILHITLAWHEAANVAEREGGCTPWRCGTIVPLFR